jgi:hypothetical protein
VLVGMTLRRQLLPGGGTRVTISSRTTRRRYQAGRQAAVAAVRRSREGGCGSRFPALAAATGSPA